ncbi:MAG: glycosyltransferase family 2 protein [Duncaniella sp.]|nr:glycosyltransferase family 2 protein [Duncaniella sp.]
MISVVIPVYNRQATLPRLLGSLEAQTRQPDRIILVDNASTDATLSILRTWASSHPNATVITETTPGASAARNAGLALVSTPWVMFFDSDDEMLPTHIADFSAAIEANPDTDIVGRSMILRCLDGSERKLWFTDRRPLFSHIFRTILATQRYAVRTELIRRAGAWQTDLSIWLDWELGIRLLLQTSRVATVPGPPSVIAYHTRESITGLSYSSRAEAIEKTIASVRPLMATQKQRDWLDARTMILAAQYAREGDNRAAERLKNEILKNTRSPLRQRIIYAHNRIFGRLTFPLAAMLF